MHLVEKYFLIDSWKASNIRVTPNNNFQFHIFLFKQTAKFFFSFFLNLINLFQTKVCLNL